MKTAGVIGGLGPETTAQFYLQTINQAKKVNTHYRPQLLIWNVPVDISLEKSFIRGEDQSDHYLALLSQAVSRLEAGGADFLVIPCNSVHVFIDSIRKEAHIPVLSIVEETTKYLLEQEIRSVGVLATTTTIESNLYGKALCEANIESLTPTPTAQRSLDTVVTKLVSGEYQYTDAQVLAAIIHSLAVQKVDAVLLACTDLQLFVPPAHLVPMFDTMKILVESTVRYILDEA